jgi:hypothetical protein
VVQTFIDSSSANNNIFNFSIFFKGISECIDRNTLRYICLKKEEKSGEEERGWVKQHVSYTQED